MPEDPRQRELRYAIDAARAEGSLNELAGAAEYRRSQRAVTRGLVNATDRAHPLRFDENGLPIPQREANFVQRVARLLSPL